MRTNAVQGGADEGRSSPERQLADFVGWFSLALGVPQLTVPGRFARFIGVHPDRRSRTWTRIVGIRELAVAAGILTQPRPVGWLWGRVAGDIKDLTLLAVALESKRERPSRITASMGAVAGIMVVDTIAAISMSRARTRVTEEGEVEVRAAITVRRSPEEVFAFWHAFENWPRFMAHLDSVQVLGDGRSHWRTKAPLGRIVEWDAETVEDRPTELIAWRALPGADVENSGVVRFAPAAAGQGTEIRLDLRYRAPGGIVGSTLAKLFGEEPEQQAKDDLRRFKQVLEAGEVVRSDGSPEGTLASRRLKQRPAYPLPGNGAAAQEKTPQAAGRTQP